MNNTRKFFYFQLYSVIFFVSNIAFTFSAIHGRYTKDIEDYELSIPHRITASGKFVTFSIPQYFKLNFHERYKRDTVPNNKKIFYNIIFNGKDHHIEVWPNHGFVSPNLISEVYNPNAPVAKRKLKRMNEKQCHYVGKVKGLENSAVAISVCDGLAGYMMTNKGHYFIEPIAEHQANANGQHVHVIYKRKLPDGMSPFGYPWNRNTPECGIRGSWVDAWTKRLRHAPSIRSTKNTTVAFVKPRYLELLLVADKRFVDFHKDNNVEQYIMTIMNMVSNYYHDASTGTQVDVHVVRIIYLEKAENYLDLSISQHAENTLHSFCKWAKRMNPKDINNPQHHDVAVLLSRYDLCSDNVTDCNLMGLAYLAAACNPDEACAINEDSGLALGITVTHEVGHVMGCGHDDGEDSTCDPQDSDGDYYVMSPYIHMATTKWSPCSKQFMTELFENGLGKCLEDEPQEALFKDLTNMPPGAVYDADFQCNNDFAGMKHCVLEESKICEMLYCKKEGDLTCTSKGEPPADGTKCGENLWCFRGKCVEMGQRPEGVDGGWGKWGEWSDCSRSCGGGISVSKRRCDNPTPQNHGRYCSGDEKRVKLCNINDCPYGVLTFREKQCSKFNDKPFKNKFHAWKPYKLDGHECELNCINEERVYVALAPRVKDGTSCKAGTKNRCIFGQCRTVGCDWQIDSEAIEDVCGICNGDGTHCTFVESIFNDTGHGYHKIVKIPAGCRNIRVNEVAASQNTIAVSSEDEKVFFLNANYTEEINGDKEIEGVRGIYDHPAEDKETLFIAGPLIKPIILYAVFYHHENPGIHYSYAEPSSKQVSSTYIWEFDDFGDCSAICGPGIRTAKPQCVEKIRGKVADEYCDKAKKPESKTVECNQRPCIIKWRPNNWGICSGCKNKPGTKTRTVDCVREPQQEEKDPVIIEDSLCKGPKPKTQEMCCSNEPCCVEEHHKNKTEVDKAISNLWPQIQKIYKRHRIHNMDNRKKPGKQNQKITIYRPQRHEIINIPGNSEEISSFQKYIIGHEIPIKIYKKKLKNIPSKNFRNVKRACNSSIESNSKINEMLSCSSRSRNICKNKKQLKTGVVQDRLPSEGNQLIQVPIKENSEDIPLSDDTFQVEGDKVADTLDFCNAKIFKGKAADTEIKRINSNCTEKPTPPCP